METLSLRHDAIKCMNRKAQSQLEFHNDKIMQAIRFWSTAGTLITGMALKPLK